MDEIVAWKDGSVEGKLAWGCEDSMGESVAWGWALADGQQ